MFDRSGAEAISRKRRETRWIAASSDQFGDQARGDRRECQAEMTMTEGMDHLELPRDGPMTGRESVTFIESGKYRPLAPVAGRPGSSAATASAITTS
ncbi:hypothetical protein NKH09_06160 [Mesorhizobium sp. M1339]|uniref:hypothetical protein n=1 Tax=unclassified Mesorhizobium TaxID=325217 RepID=UPI00333D1752